MNAKSIFRFLFWALIVLNSLSILVYLIWRWGEFNDNEFSTLFLYGPRWPYFIPTSGAALVLLVARLWKKAVAMILLSSVTLVTLCGFNLSMQSVMDPPPAFARYRVMTWNAGASKSTSAFRKYQSEILPDLIAIQESPPLIQQADFPEGWQFQTVDGGLTVASRYPIAFIETVDKKHLPLPGAATKFRIDTPEGAFLFCNVHLPTPRPGIQTALDTKFRNLDTLRNVVKHASLSSTIVRNWIGEYDGVTIVAGDFNMPVETRTYRRDWGDFANAFSNSSTGFGTTKQTSIHGVRIDHVLTGPQLKCRNAFVGKDLGSDHLPMIADLMAED